MLLYRTRVSPKTPRDGKLEVSPRAAEQLAAMPAPLAIVVNGERGTASVTTMECTCRKGEGGDRHVHSFLQSELLKRLPVESEVTVERAGGGDAVLVSSAWRARSD
ncbi:MAG TPA: hypothetical protein VKA84_00840 [Gemmatimonadaceae bacterium]|nr:hypothetical protein [Gemmatimonadaceae bacterium]